MEFLRVWAATRPEILRGTPIGHPFHTAEQPSKWMRRTIHITGKIEPFFGTLDENIRLLEDSLQVRTTLHDTRLTVEGEQDSVDQAVRIVEEYNHLTRHGENLPGGGHGGERAADQAGEPHHPGATRGGSRRAAGFPPRHAATENRSVHAAAV